jgi:hypothetical protein
VMCDDAGSQLLWNVDHYMPDWNPQKPAIFCCLFLSRVYKYPPQHTVQTFNITLKKPSGNYLYHLF